MQSITAFLEWLQALPLAVFIHNKAWAFTTVEVVHVFAIALVIGTILIPGVFAASLRGNKAARSLGH